jgi:hypothetical protein
LLVCKHWSFCCREIVKRRCLLLHPGHCVGDAVKLERADGLLESRYSALGRNEPLYSAQHNGSILASAEEHRGINRRSHVPKAVRDKSRKRLIFRCLDFKQMRACDRSLLEPC